MSMPEPPPVPQRSIDATLDVEIHHARELDAVPVARRSHVAHFQPAQHDMVGRGVERAAVVNVQAVAGRIADDEVMQLQERRLGKMQTARGPSMTGGWAGSAAAMMMADLFHHAGWRSESRPDKCPGPAGCACRVWPGPQPAEIPRGCHDRVGARGIGEETANEEAGANHGTSQPASSGLMGEHNRAFAPGAGHSLKVLSLCRPRTLDRQVRRIDFAF